MWAYALNNIIHCQPHKPLLIKNNWSNPTSFFSNVPASAVMTSTARHPQSSVPYVGTIITPQPWPGNPATRLGSAGLESFPARLKEPHRERGCAPGMKEWDCGLPRARATTTLPAQEKKYVSLERDLEPRWAKRDKKLSNHGTINPPNPSKMNFPVLFGIKRARFIT